MKKKIEFKVSFIKIKHVDFVIDEKYLFVALDEKIHKQAPKSWKTGNGEVHIGYSFSPFFNILKIYKNNLV